MSSLLPCSNFPLDFFLGALPARHAFVCMRAVYLSRLAHAFSVPPRVSIVGFR